MKPEDYCPHGYNDVRSFLMHCRRSESARWVSKAKRLGLIPMANTLKCVDCGKQASQYDHRDYAKPDKVEAVCFFCHAKRGPGYPHCESTITLLKRYNKQLFIKFKKDAKKSGSTMTSTGWRVVKAALSHRYTVEFDKLKAHNKKQQDKRLARKEEILRLRKTMTLKEIGDAWGISKQAIWMILR